MAARASLDEHHGQTNELHAIYEQARAMLSVSSISSTATASDLPGAGLTLGQFYSYLGKRLENLINRVAERHGYGPKAIEHSILSGVTKQFGYEFSEPVSKEDKQLRKDLKRLLRYAESKIQANRELACQVVVSLAVAHPCFREILRDLGAIKILALVHAREERDELYDHLLSPSRKALVCLLETGINTAGKRWILLKHAEIVSPNGSKCVFVEPVIEILNSYLDTVEFLIKHVDSSSLELSFLAMLYISRSLRVKNSRGIMIPHPALSALLYAGVRASEPCPADKADRIARIFTRFMESIHHKVLSASHHIDWDVVGWNISNVQHVFTLYRRERELQYCSQIADDLVERFPNMLSNDMVALFQSGSSMDFTSLVDQVSNLLKTE